MRMILRSDMPARPACPYIGPTLSGVWEVTFQHSNHKRHALAEHRCETCKEHHQLVFEVEP